MADRDCNKPYLPLALSSSTPSWWELHHQATCSTTSTTTSSWNNTAASSPPVVYENYNKSSACDHEDASFTASNNHSTLEVDEPFHRFVEPSTSSNDIITEPIYDNSNLWSQFLLGVEGRQKMQGEMRDDVGENILNALSLKSFSHGIFEPLACSDYLQKFDTHQHEKWDNNNGDQYPNSDKNLLFGNYPAPNTRSSDPHDGQTKENFAYQQQLCSMRTSSGNPGFDRHSYVFNHTRPDGCMREENNDQADQSIGELFHRESNIHNQNGFTPSLLKSLSLLETRKQQRTTVQGIKGQPPASTNDGKKKRLDDTPQSRSRSVKKLKHESRSSSPSTLSSSAAKARDTTQAPKVKITAEKISALQQIVSPFGKTDTASVLQEAIGFIKCHQEQVQLLSNHYLKSSVNRLQEAGRGMDRKVVGLKSKGLCLVPTSNIPQVYIESVGPDYWPAYRGCMYR